MVFCHFLSISCVSCICKIFCLSTIRSFLSCSVYAWCFLSFRVDDFLFSLINNSLHFIDNFCASLLMIELSFPKNKNFSVTAQCLSLLVVFNPFLVKCLSFLDDDYLSFPFADILYSLIETFWSFLIHNFCPFLMIFVIYQ